MRCWAELSGRAADPNAVACYASAAALALRLVTAAALRCPLTGLAG